MDKKNRIFKIVIFCVVFVGSMFLFGGKAYGVSKNELQRRAFVNNLNKCYNEQVLKPSVKIDESLKEFSIRDFLAGEDPLIYDPYGTNEGSIYMRCEELFRPSDTHNGRTISSVFGKEELVNKDGNIGSVDAIEKLLTNMGYDRGEAEKTSNKCYKFYSAIGTGRGNNVLLDICLDQDKNGKYVVTMYGPDEGKINFGGKELPDTITDVQCRKDAQMNPGVGINQNKGDRCYLNGRFLQKWGDGTSDWTPYTCVWTPNSTEKFECDMHGDWIAVYYHPDLVSYAIPPDNSPDYESAYKKARKWLTGEESGVKSFSDTDIMALYYSYILDNRILDYNDDEFCKNEKPDKLYDKKNSTYYVYNGSRWCSGAYNENVFDKKFPGFRTENTEFVYLDKMMSFEELLNDLAYWVGKKPDAVSGILADLGAERNKAQDANPKDEEDKCYTDGSAIGWMLCPAIAATTGAGQWMYGEVEKQLRVDVDIFKDDGGLVSGWEIIRNIANTVFIILFLVVIFSQLTGVGINNYGIKKILPKLIIVAILVNLSLILCELAVDLSNIAGTGLRGLFQGMAANIKESEAAASLVAEDKTSMFAGVMIGSLAGIGLFALYRFITNQTITQAAVGLLLALLGAVIAVVVAILVIFLILMIRQTGIIILVVLAPLAIVCYALPNTEKLAKKWLDLFKALLVVYPICGAMVGAGEFASKVLLNSSTPGNPLALAAMIVKVLPYFFVPMLLRRSLAMMGNVGARLSTIGRGLGRRGSTAARQGIRNSERYKDWEKYQNEQTAEARARRVHDRLINRGNLSNRQKNRLRKANEVLAAMTAQRAADANRSKESYLEASIVGSKKKFKDEEIENYMNLVNNRTNNGENEDELFKEYKDAIETNNEAKAIAIARIAGRRKDTSTRFIKEFTGTSAEDRAAHADTFRSVAKEIATGANSANYRQSSPFQFEYAARINDGKVSTSDSYDTWSQSRDNISGAIDHHITSAAEMMGMKTDALEELNEVGFNHPERITRENAEMLQREARNALALARKDPNFQESKRKELERILQWNIDNFSGPSSGHSGGGMVMEDGDMGYINMRGNSSGGSGTNNTNGGGATGPNGRGGTDIT